MASEIARKKSSNEAREGRLPTASDRNDRRRCLHIGDGLRRTLVFRLERCHGTKSSARSRRSAQERSARYAGWGRVIPRSGGAHAVELRGVFLSATKDFCRQTRIAPRGHRTAGHARSTHYS